MIMKSHCLPESFNPLKKSSLSNIIQFFSVLLSLTCEIITTFSYIKTGGPYPDIGLITANSIQKIREKGIEVTLV